MLLLFDGRPALSEEEDEFDKRSPCADPIKTPPVNWKNDVAFSNVIDAIVVFDTRKALDCDTRKRGKLLLLVAFK